MDMTTFRTLPKKKQMEVFVEILGVLAKQQPKRKMAVLKAVMKRFRPVKKRGKMDVTAARDWLHDKLSTNMKLTPKEAAGDYVKEKGIASNMLPCFLGVARNVKEAISLNNKRRAKRGLPPLEIGREKRSVTSASIEQHKDPLMPDPPVAEKMGDALASLYRAAHREAAKSSQTIDDIKELVGDYGRFIGRTLLERPIEDFIEKLQEDSSCPSVLPPPAPYDMDSTEISGHKGLYDLLSSVSLLDHTYHVLVQAMAILRGYGNHGRSIETYGPDVILACLAHDIGVSPKIREKKEERSVDHAVLSSWVLESSFDKAVPLGEAPGGFKPIRDAIVTAVKNHHLRNPRNQEVVMEILREADLKARNLEVIALNPSVRLSPLQDWLKPEELLKLIEPRINILVRNRFAAFSQGSIVFATENCLLDAVRKLAISENVFDIALIRGSEKHRVLLEVVNLMKTEKMDMVRNLPDGRYANYYTFGMKKLGSPIDRATMRLIPLKIDKFAAKPWEMDKRKANTYLDDIIGVVKSTN